MKKLLLKALSIICAFAILGSVPLASAEVSVETSGSSGGGFGDNNASVEDDLGDSDPNVWNGFDLSSNDDVYGKAIWTKDATYHETVMIYNGRGDIKLLYPIKNIVSVRSYDLQTVYNKGTDYDVKDGKLVIPSGSAIPSYATPADFKNLNADGSVNWGGIGGWTSKSYKYQVQVTYTHDSNWDGVSYAAPKSELSKLKKFYNKAKSGKATNIVFYGDSITVGWNASGLKQQTLSYSNGNDASTLSTITSSMYGNFGLSDVPEWGLKSYPVQVYEALKKQFNNDNLVYVNKSIASTSSAWASKSQNLSFLLGNTAPDILFIAYGMNEYTAAASTQSANTKKIIDYARTLNPDCAIVLVSAFYPNRYNSASATAPHSGTLGEHEDAYYELAKQYDGVIVAPVYSMFENMLKTKEAVDYTSNIFNHPNDFGCRLYADTIMSVLGETKSTACEINGHGATKHTGAVPAKCGVKGYTGDKICTVCDSITEKGTATPALAHSYGAYKVTTKATTSKNGVETATCVRSGCGHKITKTIYKASSIKLSTSSYTYDGKKKTPSVYVKDYKGNKLKKDTDYTVKFSSSKRKTVGRYKVTITLKGKYSGTKYLYFTIVPKNIKLKSVKAGSKSLTVKWTKTSSHVKGYEIQYSTSSKFSKKYTKTVKATSYKSSSKTIKKLKAKKKYYVRIRAYKTVSGKTYVSKSWSSKKYATTKK